MICVLLILSTSVSLLERERERERVCVNLVDLFNFAEECERNKFNYKLGDFTKIDFLGWRDEMMLKTRISVISIKYTNLGGFNNSFD